MTSNKDSNVSFENILSQFGSSVNKISDFLTTSLDEINYEELSTENKVRYDLLLAYSLNGLLWVYMRTKGEDPAQTIIKTELNRVKENMSELQHTIDRKTIMPRLDKGATKRFVKHGLWQKKNPKHVHFSD
ncbi:hypothetical protein PGB90_004966 [Kerria lacca]